MNSGVWHDPSYGQSGVLRFSQNLDTFEVSIDGGWTFDALPGSGQIQESINASAGGAGTPHTQQAAYDGGNEIDTILKGEAYQGVVIYEPPTPFSSDAGWDDTEDPFIGHTTFGFAVSGAPTPGDDTRSALSRLTSQFLHIRSSGIDVEQAGAFFGFHNGNPEQLHIASSGGLFIEAQANCIHDIGGQKLETIEGSWQVNTQGFQSFISSKSIDFNATTSLDMSAATDRLILDSYAGSGHLEYRFGPYEAWHTKVGAGNETLVPIPHSGQVLQMILENGGGGTTLQTAYDAGQRITVASNGPVHIDGDINYALRLDVTEDDHPHILMSGVTELPSLGQTTPGALWLQGHSAGILAQLTGGSIPTTRAEASAKSLGIDTLFYATGSGIASVRTASGVSQFFNVGSSASIDENGLIIPFALQTAPSTFYHTTTTSGIQIFVPGQYKMSYTAILEKTTGNLTQQVDAELRLRDKWGQEFRFMGSQSAAVIRDSANLNRNTCNGQTLVDLHSGDAIVVFLEHNGSPPAGNSVNAKARSSNIIVEWIGPLAGGGIVKQKV
jgi:hypothetical protein